MICLPQEILFPEADKLSRIVVERSRISAWYLEQAEVSDSGQKEGTAQGEKHLAGPPLEGDRSSRTSQCITEPQ